MDLFLSLNNLYLVYMLENRLTLRTQSFQQNSDKLRCYEHAKEAQDSVNQLFDLEKDSKPLPTEEQRSAAEETRKYVRSFILFALKGIRNMRA